MLVSIGVPTFNRPQGLQKTLKCLTEQSYRNIEIIVSDNCSPTSEVENIVKQFSDKDDRIKFYRQSENKGPAYNFKFVLKKAVGDYFMWAADDDWWDSNFIKNVIALIQQTPGAIAGFCNYSVVNEENVPVPYPNALPYLLDLHHTNDFTRLSSFINQYEGYGKSNIFYSIIKLDVIKNIPFDLVNEKVPMGGDLSIIYSWLRSGNIVICKDVLRRTTIGNEKQNAQFITEFENKTWNLLLLTINIGKMLFYWKTWKQNLFFYFYLTRTAQISFFTKSLLHLTISKKILLFIYDLVCYNVVLKGFNIFQFLKRKQSLAQ